MKKLLKFFLILISAVLLIVIISGILLKLYFPPEKIKKIATSKIEKNLKREVKIKDVSVSIIKGIKINKISISEYPDFSRGLFLDIERLNLRVSIFPLIFKKSLIIKKFQMLKPTIRIIRYPDKSFNFETLIKKRSQHRVNKREKTKEKESLKFFSINACEIKDGTVIFTDYSQKQKIETEVKNINIKISGTSIAKPVSFSVSNRIELKKFPQLKKPIFVDILLSGILDILKQEIILKESSISTEILNLKLNGTIENIRKNPELNIKTNYNLHLENLGYYLNFDTNTITVKKTISGSINLSGNQEKIKAEGKVNFDKCFIEVKNLFRKKEQIPLNINYSLLLKNLKSVRINWVILKISENQISLTGFLRKDGFYRLNTDVENFKLEDAKNYILPLRPYEISGRIKLTTLIKPSEFKGVLETSEISLKKDFLSLKNIRSEIDFYKNNIKISRISGELNDGYFNFSGEISNFLKPDYLTAKFNLFTRNLSIVIPEKEKQKKEQTEQVEKREIEFSEGIKITGKINSINTKIKNVPVLKNIIKKLEIEKELGEPVAKRITADFFISKAKLNLKTFKMTSDKLKIYSKGKMNLKDFTLDLSADLRIAPGILRGDLSKYTKDEDGWNKIELNIKGKVNSPSIKIATYEIIKKAIEDKGKKLIEKGLQKLFKK